MLRVFVISTTYPPFLLRPLIRACRESIGPDSGTPHRKPNTSVDGFTVGYVLNTHAGHFFRKTAA